MKTWECPTCGRLMQAIGTEVTCIGRPLDKPPVKHMRTLMKEVVHA